MIVHGQALVDPIAGTVELIEELADAIYRAMVFGPDGTKKAPNVTCVLQ